MMTISDPRFASQIVTNSGKTIQFDSIECMATHEGAGNFDEVGILMRRVSDYATKTLVDIDSVQFIRGDQYFSPMGAGLVAFTWGTSASHDFDGGQQQMTYEDVQEYASSLLLRNDDRSPVNR
jgi:copper chaperone NosL